MSLDDALKARRSVRAFRPDPVPRALIEEILQVASRAPSGTNIQPWKIHVVAGEVRERLVREVLAHRQTGPADTHAEFPRWAKRKEPYITRMRTLGKAMYGLLGVPRGDPAANDRQWARNYQFFDAPVGLMFTIDRRLATGSWLDYGMFLQNVMTAARGRGLDTCAQAAWAHYHRAIRPVLGMEDEEIVVCGMALGYADPDAPENSLVTSRTAARTFMRFDGFADGLA